MVLIRGYECEICGRAYASNAAARACETQLAQPLLVNVGDIVLAGAAFGWFDGDKRWVANYERLKTYASGQDRKLALERGGKQCRDYPAATNCFKPCCTYEFYYVVTKIDNDRNDRGGGYYLGPIVEGEKIFMHRPRYHLWTKAMTGKHGHESGYTMFPGHIKPRSVMPRPLLHGVETLIDKEARGLL